MSAGIESHFLETVRLAVSRALARLRLSLTRVSLKSHPAGIRVSRESHQRDKCQVSLSQGGLYRRPPVRLTGETTPERQPRNEPNREARP